MMTDAVTLLTVMLSVFLKAIACVFAADLLSGLFHWLEDAYGKEHYPITGRFVTAPNILHHKDPGYFTCHSWLRSASVLIVLCTMLGVASYLVGWLNWMTALVLLLGVNANEIHKWAHRSRARNGRLISFLQDRGLIQSPSQHRQHHRGSKDTNYCVITNYLNPLLDAVNLWNRLERAIYSLTGVRRRRDEAV